MVKVDAQQEIGSGAGAVCDEHPATDAIMTSERAMLGVIRFMPFGQR
jgi:hypothetical protein